MRAVVTPTPEKTASMDNDQVILRKEGAVVRIVLNNPARLNAISIAMWDRLDQILDDLAEDRAVRVVVISGAGGKAFSSGGHFGIRPPARRCCGSARGQRA